MVRGPLGEGELSPPLALRRCRQAPHSVLAAVSSGFPHLRDRLPTCSSPFRHSHRPVLLPSGSRPTCMPNPRYQLSFLARIKLSEKNFVSFRSRPPDCRKAPASRTKPFSLVLSLVSRVPSGGSLGAPSETRSSSTISSQGSTSAPRRAVARWVANEDIVYQIPRGRARGKGQFSQKSFRGPAEGAAGG